MSRLDALKNKPRPMATKIGARKSAAFKAISIAPSLNKTLVGNSVVVIPYVTVAEFSNSVSAVPNVRFNGDAVYVMDQTSQSTCNGDEAGSLGGVKSGTVSGEVKPVTASLTVRVAGKRVVRDGDRCTMNGGNNPGMYVTVELPAMRIKDGRPEGDTNPRIVPQTPAEEQWFAQFWLRSKRELTAAAIHPLEGVKGVAKGVLNTPSDIGELLLQNGRLKSARILEEQANELRDWGHARGAEELMQTAQEERARASEVELPPMEMSNDAQSGGDLIATVSSFFASGGGFVKGMVRSSRRMTRVGIIADGANVTRKDDAASPNISEKKGAQTVLDVAGGASAGDGVKISGKRMSSSARATITNEAEIVAKDRTRVNGFTKHGVDRAIGDTAKRSGTKPQAILDAIRNPKRIQEGIDRHGRPFKIFHGKDARVVLNQETGKIISTNPRSCKGAT